MARGYILISADGWTAVKAMQGMLSTIDTSNTNYRYGHGQRIAAVLQRKQPAAGLYRCKFTSESTGAGCRAFYFDLGRRVDCATTEANRLQANLDKQQRRARTGSPGITGYLQAENAATARLQNNAAETAQLIDWLREQHEQHEQHERMRRTIRQTVSRFNVSHTGSNTMHATHNIDDTTIIFNTGCMYTMQGQVIVARKLDNGAIAFADVSRMIDGTIAADDCPRLDGWAINKAYLHNKYVQRIDNRDLRDELRQLGEDHSHRVAIDARRPDY